MKTDLYFVEKAPHEKGFAEYFEQRIKPKLLEMEHARLAALATSRKKARLAILGGVTILVAAVSMLLHLEAARQFWWFFVLGLVIAGWKLCVWASNPTIRYSADRKQTIVPDVLKFVGDFLYEPNGKIDDDILRTSHLFEYWNSNDSEGSITGRYNDRAFQFVEARLSYEAGENSRAVFKGFIVALQTQAQWSHTSVAVRDRGKDLAWPEGERRSLKGLKRVSFDSPDFDDTFEVFSTHEAEARLLITPRLIEAVLNIGKLSGVETIEFGINRGAFLLKIETDRELFEPVGLDKSALTSDESRRILEELHDVLGIVETVALATGSDSEPFDNG
jgi:hypothetical protein